MVFNKSKPTSYISVCAISYNEENDIKKFIDNMKEWVEEIVIVDDESTDETKRIARQYDEVIFIQNSRGPDEGLADQRNLAVEYASSEWVLHTDIDERIPPALALEMLDVISDTSCNAFRFRRRNYFLHRRMVGGGWTGWNEPHLARRQHHHLEGRIHETVIVEGGEEKIGQLENHIWHLNDESFKERMDKSLRYSKSRADQIIQNQKDIRWYHIVWYSVRIFLVRYFYRFGFRDGVVGLIWALHSFAATIQTYSVVWDHQNRISRGKLEKEVESMWKKDENNIKDR